MSLPHLQKKTLLRNFNCAATTYAEYSLVPQAIAERLFERLELIKLNPSTIVDFGCSTGHCTRQLAERYPSANIIGLDFAPTMIAVAEQTPHPNIRYLQADAQATGLADQSVDLIVSNLLLYYCDPELLFAEFKRILKPNGLILFATLGPATLQELRYAWAQVDQQTHVYAFMDMHHIGDLLLEAQFADPVMDMEMLTFSFSDAMSAMHSLKAIGEQNALMGRSDHLIGKNKLQQVTEHYAAFRAEDGTLPLSYEVIYGHAWQPDMSAQQSMDEQGAVHVPLKLVKRR